MGRGAPAHFVCEGTGRLLQRRGFVAGLERGDLVILVGPAPFSLTPSLASAIEWPAVRRTR
jgi:hypothetical protein